MRECGECTLCCKLLEVHDIPSPIGVYCQHCDKGCTIHESRPQECRGYQCMWSQMDDVGMEMRPDQCGIIFDRMSDDVISARLEEGMKLKPLVMGQINAFINEGFSILIFRGKDSKCFLNTQHTEQYVRDTIHGCSIVH